MIGFNFDSDCCGCGVCAESCPRKCITIRPNDKGFLTPLIDTSTCIDCGLCERVCPIINVNESVSKNDLLYCSYHKDNKVRDAGSSGSVFYALAQFVLSQNGFVAGAAFEDNLQLRHVLVDNMDDLLPLLKSKYIQSNTNGIFKKVKEKLKLNKYVLFVGTPCQTQALFNYLGRKTYDNLIIVDFICHGVPSQELFDRCIREYERKNQCKVIDFSFRKKSKDFLRNCLVTKQLCKSRAIVSELVNARQFPYYNGFLKYITFRNSCYNCKFVGNHRISDFTLGDFWGIENKGIVNDFNLGYSMLYVNTEKGKSILNEIKDVLYLKPYEVDSPYSFNYAYLKPTKRSILNRAFMWDYNRLSQEKLEKRYFQWNKKSFNWIIYALIKKLKI